MFGLLRKLFGGRKRHDCCQPDKVDAGHELEVARQALEEEAAPKHALHHICAALSVDPNLDFLWLDVGDLCLDQGKLDVALSAYTHASDLASPAPWAEASALYCRSLLEVANEPMEALLLLAESGNDRAGFLLQKMFAHYQEFLPDSYEATASIFR